jgi:hypothetical protein
VRAEDRVQVADFERAGRHGCLFPRLVSEVVLRTVRHASEVPLGVAIAALAYGSLAPAAPMAMSAGAMCPS